MTALPVHKQSRLARRNRKYRLGTCRRKKRVVPEGWGDRGHKADENEPLGRTRFAPWSVGPTRAERLRRLDREILATPPLSPCSSPHKPPQIPCACATKSGRCRLPAGRSLAVLSGHLALPPPGSQ